MKTWNYRRVTNVVAGKRFFAITEVYYNDKGEPISHISTEASILSHWDTEEELNGTFEQIKEAFVLPVLDLDSWKKEGDTFKDYNPDEEIK